MLLKYSQLQKRNKLAGKAQRSTGNNKSVHGKGKGHRKGIKSVASKRIKNTAPRREEVFTLPVDPCDNSNDSGLGFDHNLDLQVPRTTQSSFTEQEYFWPDVDAKKQRVEIKLESDNANDDFTFPHNPRILQPSSTPTAANPRQAKAVPPGKSLKRATQSGLGQNVGLSRDGKVQLVIVSQPELQHRARYQTEGSRGAVKDRSGNGFPIVKLNGYSKPATLEVYIGTDQGRETPHMFYQACRVSGKNSTPCVEKNVSGTVLIEIEFEPLKEMTVTCDCVGILKERNVDVEHRFPEESPTRNKKKSTRCRMVFRTVITNSDNVLETLQVTSQPIICTQPPGVPEICKKSVVSCHSPGGLELFILGKNFLKDTRVVFSVREPNTDNYWEAVVQPDKEFLQQSHLVCTIPPYKVEDIKEPVVVKLNVVSSGRSSESHTFLYTPRGTPPLQALPREPVVAARAALAHCVSQPVVPFPTRSSLLGMPLIQLGSHATLPAATFIQSDTSNLSVDGDSNTMLMPPPPSTVVPPARRSPPTIGDLQEERGVELKREVESPPSQQQPAAPPDLAISQTPSMATFRQYVSNTPLPALSVENYLSNIESSAAAPVVVSSLVSSPIGGPKPFIEPSAMTPSEQIASLENQIAVSIANEAQVASKLNAFVKSSVESQLNSANTERGSSEGELIIGSVRLSTHSSALNINQHTTITTALSPLQIASMDQKSPPQAALCELLSEAASQSPVAIPLSSQLLEASLVPEPTNSLLMPASYSPGKDMMVSGSMDMSASTASSYSVITSTSSEAATASNLLMTVVEDLTHPTQFSSLEPSAQTNPIQSTILPSFVPQNLMTIPTSNYTSLALEHKNVISSEMLSTQSHFPTSMITSELINSSSNGSGNMVTITSSESIANNKDVTFGGGDDIVMGSHFSSPVMDTSLSLPLSSTEVKTLNLEVSASFANALAFTSTAALSVPKSEPMSLGSSSFGDVTSVPMNLDSSPFVVPSEQMSLGEPQSFESGTPGGEPMSIGTQFDRVSNVSVELKPSRYPTNGFSGSSPMDQQQASPPQATNMGEVAHLNVATIKSENIVDSSIGNDVGLSSTSPFHQNMTAALVGRFSTSAPASSPPSFSTSATSTTTNSQVMTVAPVVVVVDGLKVSHPLPGTQIKKCEDGMPLPQELTQMSEHDLLSYINPSCFDTV